MKTGVIGTTWFYWVSQQRLTTPDWAEELWLWTRSVRKMRSCVTVYSGQWLDRSLLSFQWRINPARVVIKTHIWVFIQWPLTWEKAERGGSEQLLILQGPLSFWDEAVLPFVPLTLTVDPCLSSWWLQFCQASSQDREEAGAWLWCSLPSLRGWQWKRGSHGDGSSLSARWPTPSPPKDLRASEAEPWATAGGKEKDEDWNGARSEQGDTCHCPCEDAAHLCVCHPWWLRYTAGLPTASVLVWMLGEAPLALDFYTMLLQLNHCKGILMFHKDNQGSLW
jgi:hypothetical protein